jgi:hypothetical protein
MFSLKSFLDSEKVIGERDKEHTILKKLDKRKSALDTLELRLNEEKEAVSMVLFVFFVNVLQMEQLHDRLNDRLVMVERFQANLLADRKALDAKRSEFETFMSANAVKPCRCKQEPVILTFNLQEEQTVKRAHKLAERDAELVERERAIADSSTASQQLDARVRSLEVFVTKQQEELSARLVECTNAEAAVTAREEVAQRQEQLQLQHRFATCPCYPSAVCVWFEGCDGTVDVSGVNSNTS